MLFSGVLPFFQEEMSKGQRGIERGEEKTNNIKHRAKTAK
jgi:hypothetical protein